MKRIAIVSLMVAWFSLPAFGGKSTYERRFVNRTSVAIAYFKAVDGAWEYQFTVYPGLANVLEGPKHPDYRDIWGADVGADFVMVDLMRNDFGTVDWRWTIGESIPR